MEAADVVFFMCAWWRKLCILQLFKARKSLSPENERKMLLFSNELCSSAETCGRLQLLVLVLQCAGSVVWLSLSAKL